MIYAIAVFFLISIMSISILRLTTDNSVSSDNEQLRDQAEYIARAGIEIGMAAIEVKDDTKGGATLSQRVLGKVSDPSYELAGGYTNLTNSTGDIIDVKDASGNVVGKVQVIVYSITGREGDPGEITFNYISPSPSGEASKTISRHREAQRLGVDKDQEFTWIFRIVAIGQTLDYDSVKEKYPMARQVMTADVSMASQPKVWNLYSGY